MKLWLTVSEWYPIWTLSHKKDIASSSDIKLEIPDELWERWKLMMREFNSMQRKLEDIHVKCTGKWVGF